MDNKIETNIREFAEGLPVQIAEVDGELCVVATNEGGFNCTQVPMVDVLRWMADNRPDLLPGHPVPKKTVEALPPRAAEQGYERVLSEIVLGFDSATGSWYECVYNYTAGEWEFENNVACARDVVTHWLPCPPNP